MSSERNITSMKRKFISHIKCEKQIKKVKNSVEDLVEVCYLDTIRSMIEAASLHVMGAIVHMKKELTYFINQLL